MKVTNRMADAKLVEVGRQLETKDFIQFVYLATDDSISMYDRAVIRRYGEWYLIWTENRGFHKEHLSEVNMLRIGEMGSEPELLSSD